MVDHAYAEVNGVRLHYVITGQGKLLLFLHGFPEFWYLWKEQLREFSDDHCVAALDMRGYNLSSKPSEIAAYRIDLLTKDVRALVGELGYERFTLVGHDWGGIVSWAFALRYPSLLEKLIIINAPHPAIFQRELRENPAQQAASQYMHVFRSPAAEQTLSANNYAMLVDGVLKDLIERGCLGEADKKAYIEAWSQPGALTGGLNYYRAARIGPPTGEEDVDLDGITRGLPSLIVEVPTLVIWGEKDPYLLPSNLVGLEEYVANLTIRRAPLGTHWVIHEKPDYVNSCIADFIRKKV
jgi:epoxide hydrolase 4